VQTQYRNWVYDPVTLRLSSKTSPEAGTTTYTYNSDNTLATVTDAKNQRMVWTYDIYGRATQIARGNMAADGFIEDPTQRTSYTYDGDNGGYSTSTAGRTSQITYPGPHGLSLTEWYSYTKPGAVAGKRLNLTGTAPGAFSLNLDASYSFDSEGNTTSIQYPNAQFNSDGSTVAGPGFSYSFDSMGRLAGMADQAGNALVSSASYGPAGEPLQLVANTFTENRTWNASLQMVELVSGSAIHFKYSYPAARNSGQILSQQDVVSGETTAYQYDDLNRLIQASATGDPSGSWSQSFTYDGFGNLSQIAGDNAPGLSVAVDSATNRLQTSANYDANGNMTGDTGAIYAYDIQNRMTQANPVAGGTVLYGYDPANRRIYKGAFSNGTYNAEEIYFYGADGLKYGTWQLNPSPGVLLQAGATKQWFGSRLLSPQDLLASRGRYFPYGQERVGTSPANPVNDQEKFASYTRDSATGLDYAYQRYYNDSYGRFNSPNSGAGSAPLGTPQGWNLYTYTLGDPLNRNDPSGQNPNGISLGW
jgi:RHS repeat-associated protein